MKASQGMTLLIIGIILIFIGVFLDVLVFNTIGAFLFGFSLGKFDKYWGSR